MSVIELNLWINYQVLKSAHQQLRSFVSQGLKTLYKQTVTANETLVGRLIGEIHKRDAIIKQLKNKADKENKYNSNCIEPTKKIGILGSKYKNSEQYERIIKQLNSKYDDVVKQNKQYEAEFVALVDEMKSIKGYLEEFKRVRDVKHAEGEDGESPARRLSLQQQQQILSKISSLSRLQSINLTRDLDIIREVTQISAHSDQQYEPYSEQSRAMYLQIQQEELPAMSKLLMKSISQSKSFQCMNQIYDVGNLLLHSRSTSSKILTKTQTLEESLGVLKNYGSTQDISIVQSRLPPIFTIYSLQNLSLPILRLKDVVNQKHLIFQGGYTYTGNTIISIEGAIMPSGFGQLFSNGQLVYRGQWKNGLFEGWGKMHIINNQTIINFDGKWEQGLAHGPGTITFANSQKFSGTFKHGQICGEGAYFREEKRIYQGYWQNNSLVKQEI